MQGALITCALACRALRRALSYWITGGQKKAPLCSRSLVECALARRALRRDARDSAAAKEAELKRLEAARASEEALRLAARRGVPRGSPEPARGSPEQEVGAVVGARN